MSKTALLAASVFLLAVVVVLLVARPLNAPASRPVATVPAPVSTLPSPGSAPLAAATPDPGDSALAKDSTDPNVAGFISSFRTSSQASCRNSTNATLKTDANPEAAARVGALCDCATDRTLATLTVGDVRAAMLGALTAAGSSANPAIQKLRAGYTQAATDCLANRVTK